MATAEIQMHGIYRVSQKSSPPPKTFWNIFTSVKFFVCEISQFISTYIHQFLYIHLNISSKGVIFSTSTHRFHLVTF